VVTELNRKTTATNLEHIGKVQKRFLLQLTVRKGNQPKGGKGKNMGKKWGETERDFFSTTASKGKEEGGGAWQNFETVQKRGLHPDGFYPKRVP